MAAVTLLGTVTWNTSSGTKTVTATPAVDDLIVIVTAHTGNTSVATPTDNNSSGTYVEVETAQKNSSADTMRVFVRTAKIGSAVSTIFTHAPGTSTGGGLAVFKVTGMSRVGSNSVRQTCAAENQAAGTPAPVFGSAALTANALIGAVFNATNPAGMTAPTGWTEASDSGYNTPASGLETVERDSGFTGTTVTWGSSSASAYSAAAIELDTSVPQLDDGDWWGGAQRCMVGVIGAGLASAALGTAALAHSVANQHQDFTQAPPAAIPTDTGGANQWRAVAEPSMRLWSGDAEFVPPPAAVALDDGVWWQPPKGQEPAVLFIPQHQDTLVHQPGEAASPPPTWRALTDPVMLRWDVGDEFVGTAPVVALDEDYWQQPVVAPTGVRFDLPWQDERAPTAFEPESWEAPPLPSIAPRVQVWTDTGQPPEQGTFEEDAWTAPIVASPLLRSIQPWAQDDLPTQAAPEQPGAFEATSGWRAVAEPKLIRWQQTEELPTPAAPAFEVEGWEAPPLVGEATYTVWAEDETPPFAPAEEQPGGVDGPSTWRAQFEARVIRWHVTEDELPPLPPADEQPGGLEGANTWRAQVDPNVIRWQVGSDEIVPPPAPLNIDELYAVTWMPVQPASTGWLANRLMLDAIGNEDATDLVAPPQPLTEWRRFAMNRRGR